MPCIYSRELGARPVDVFADVVLCSTFPDELYFLIPLGNFYPLTLLCAASFINYY